MAIIKKKYHEKDYSVWHELISRSLRLKENPKELLTVCVCVCVCGGYKIMNSSLVLRIMLHSSLDVLQMKSERKFDDQ